MPSKLLFNTPSPKVSNIKAGLPWEPAGKLDEINELVALVKVPFATYATNNEATPFWK